MIDRITKFGKRYGLLWGSPLGVVTNVSMQYDQTYEVVTYTLTVVVTTGASSDEESKQLLARWFSKIGNVHGGAAFLVIAKPEDVGDDN